MTEILQWVLIALSIPFIVIFVMYTLRRARELERRIDEYHEEQEAARKQPGPINPYEAMAGLFVEAESGEQRAEAPDPGPQTHDPGPGDEEPPQ